MTATLLSLNIAAARALAIDGREVMSGIVKRGVAGPVAVRAMGLAGDEQADLSVHGGLSKAVYAYPSEHYGFWQTVRAQAKAAAWVRCCRPARWAKTSRCGACSKPACGSATCCASPTANSPSANRAFRVSSSTP